MHYQRDGKTSEDTNKNILKESIIDTVKKVRDNPAKVLLVPALCAGYLMFFGALYANVIVYHARTNRTTRRKSRY